MGKHCNHGVCLFHYSSAAIITRVISDSTVRTNLGPRPPSCCSQYLQFMVTSPARLVGNYQLQGKPPNQQLSLFIQLDCTGSTDCGEGTSCRSASARLQLHTAGGRGAQRAKRHTPYTGAHKFLAVLLGDTGLGREKGES